MAIIGTFGLTDEQARAIFVDCERCYANWCSKERLIFDDDQPKSLNWGLQHELQIYQHLVEHNVTCIPPRGFLVMDDARDQYVLFVNKILGQPLLFLPSPEEFDAVKESYSELHQAGQCPRFSIHAVVAGVSLCHVDIKPEHIVLQRSDDRIRAILIDFDLAVKFDYGILLISIVVVNLR